MKKMIFVLAACFLINSPSWAKKATKEIKGITMEELKWEPNPERPDEVQVAVVRGNMKKGSHAAFQKFKPGFSVENHTHSSSFHEIVIAGTWVTGPESSPKTYGPGSYVDCPAGVPHITKCTSTTECLVYIESSGKFDMHMAKEAKKK